MEALPRPGGLTDRLTHRNDGTASPDDHTVRFPGQAVHFLHRDLVDFVINLGLTSAGGCLERKGTKEDRRQAIEQP